MNDASHELERLARLLLVEAEDLATLRGVAPEALRELHDQASDAILEANRHALEPVVGLATRLPGAVIGKLIRMVLDPRVAARAVALLPHEQAVALADGLPVDLLADIAAVADPRHLGRAMAELPIETIEAVTGELVDRGDEVAIRGLLPELRGERRAAAEEALGDLAPAG